MTPAIRSTQAVQPNVLQNDSASLARTIIRNSTTAQGVDVSRVKAQLDGLSQSNPALGAQTRSAIARELTPVQQGQLARLSAQSTSAASNVSPIVRTAEPPVDTAKMALDLTQMALDIVGIFEPTPFADGANTLISLGRGEWGQAGLSALGIIPYLGDAAKLGKLGKWGKTITNAIDAAAGNPAVRKALEPALQKVADALHKIPQSALDKLPKSARDQLSAMKTKLDDFILKGKIARMTDAQLIDGLATATGSKAASFASEIAARSTHSAGSADRVVLGKWPGYINEAKANGGKWYETSENFFSDLKAKVGPEAAAEKAWMVNEAFLEQQLKSGVGKIQFTQEGLKHAMENPNSFSAKELNFLKQHAAQYGYELQGLAFVKK